MRPNPRRRRFGWRWTTDSLQSAPVIIPYETLSEDALHAVIEEFVTRDGTDHTDVAPRIRRVLEQLKAGEVVLTFDSESRTTGIQPADGA